MTYRAVSTAAWRFTGIFLAVVMIGLALSRLSLVVIPLFVAIIVSVVLRIPVKAMTARGVPPLLATWMVFTATVGAFAGLAVWIAPRFVAQLSNVGDSVSSSITETQNWLRNGPLDLSRAQLQSAIDSLQQELHNRSQQLATGAVTTATVGTELLAGTLLTLVLTFFFVKDGDRIGGWLLDLMPRNRRERIHAAASEATDALRGYLLGVATDGLVTAVLKAIGLWVLGVPLILPLAILTFFSGFFPMVGALVAGGLAAIVALVAVGPGTALAVIVLAIVLQNVVSNLIDPLIMSKATQLHPVMVLLAVTTGGVLWGIAGAFVAVPSTAVAAAVFRYYREHPVDDTHSPSGT